MSSLKSLKSSSSSTGRRTLRKEKTMQSSNVSTRSIKAPSVDCRFELDFSDEDALETRLAGMCCGNPATNTGKCIKVLKILSVTLLPILSLWAFTVYSLSDSIEGKADIEQTQYAVKFSVEIGMFLDRIQRERDMAVLYLSILGPETKTFLMNEYLLTDQALDHLSDWPVRDDISKIFQSKKNFKSYLIEHRQNLDPNNYDLYVEMDFYNFLIERFIEWMYGAIKESKMASIWKILVAYQKIVTVMEHIGFERALGTVFYVEGGFSSKNVYEKYNNRVAIFKANYRSAVLYSKAVDPIYQSGVTSTGTNLTSVIESFRYEIQFLQHTDASVAKGQWWFDNMTLYLDTLLIIQQKLAYLINGQLEEIIQTEENNLTISACFLVIVFLMFPLVIFSVETLTADIQKYALELVRKTKELSEGKQRTNDLLFQMVPEGVPEMMIKKKKDVFAEYIRSATVMFLDICPIDQSPVDITAGQMVAFLNDLYEMIDEKSQDRDVCTLNAVKNSYMIVSGAPNRVGSRHSTEIANLSLDLLDAFNERFSTISMKRFGLRIGVNTGPCVAGIFGKTVPRFSLFGETINIAARMRSSGMPNRVHITSSSYKALKKHKIYVMAFRGHIMATQDGGPLATYWLLTRTTGESKDEASTALPSDLSVDVGDYNEDAESQIHHQQSKLQTNKFGTFDLTKCRFVRPDRSQLFAAKGRESKE